MKTRTKQDEDHPISLEEVKKRIRTRETGRLSQLINAPVHTLYELIGQMAEKGGTR